MYGNRAIPSPFYCPEANKEVTGALAVGYGMAKKILILLFMTKM